MYNDPKEIIFLLSLPNINDGQRPLKASDIFDKQGKLKVDKDGSPIGKEELLTKANGYVFIYAVKIHFSFHSKYFRVIFLNKIVY